MIFNILDHGARRDGKIYTKEIQSAIDACFLAGGGEVTVPEGDFITGGLRLRSGVTLHLLAYAHLIGSVDPEDYLSYLDDEIEPIPEADRGKTVSTVVPGHTCFSAIPYSRWNNAIIRAFNASDISIIGDEGSVIDGQNCFDEQGEENYRGPHAINMWFCENVRLEGYTIKDSANWAHAIHNSRNIALKGVTVLGGHDGFDVRTCDNVLVEDCVFRTGDDCIAGFDNVNVTVRRCIFDSACSMLRFGGTNVLVEDCEGSVPSTYGFRGHLTPEQKRARAATDENCRHSCHNVFLYYCDDRAQVRHTPGGIRIINSKFHNPDMIMRLPFGHKWCCNRSLCDITFENCVIDGLSKTSPLTCPENEPLHLYMKNCTLSAREGFEDVTLIEGKNVGEICFRNVTVQGFGVPSVKCDDGTEISVIGGTEIVFRRSETTN